MLIYILTIFAVSSKQKTMKNDANVIFLWVRFWVFWLWLRTETRQMLLISVSKAYILSKIEHADLPQSNLNVIFLFSIQTRIHIMAWLGYCSQARPESANMAKFAIVPDCLSELNYSRIIVWGNEAFWLENFLLVPRLS